jgi:hypothetical protein
MCDWPREYFAQKLLAHLELTTTILLGAGGNAGGKVLNSNWEIKDVPGTVETVGNCIDGTQQPNACDSPAGKTQIAPLPG